MNAANSVFAGLVAVVVLAASAVAAPFAVGDEATLGTERGYNWNSFLTLNSSFEELSYRFTAFDDATVRSARIGIVSWGGADLAVGLMADDGFGNPDGVWLGSGSANPSSNHVDIAFADAVQLQQGQVYHLVSRAEFESDNTKRFRIAGTDPTAPAARRPYDMALDPAWRILQGDGQGNWTQRDADNNPLYVLYSDADATQSIAGFGQPYSTTNSNLVQTTNNTDQGQAFSFGEHELAPGTGLRVDSVRMGATAANNPENDLGIQVRDSEGNVLATATLAVDDADGSVRTLALDQPVVLMSGETYLLTTTFGEPDPDGAGIRRYRFVAWQTIGSDTTAGHATWGGSNLIHPIASGDGWATWSPTNDTKEVLFSFTGTVVPEPATMGLLGAGALALLRRR